MRQLPHYWPFWARPQQIPPPGSWRTWLILAGRGFGKTRTGAEWVRDSVKQFPLVNVIAATADDARDIMVEGESGILACCPPGERPAYRASMRRLEWPNGARTLIFTADEPERLRGKQHMRLWADELAAWRYPEAWDQAMFGLRLGADPRAVVTTTPKPTEIMRRLIADPTTYVTRGSTYENRANLAPAFFEQIIRRYEGTRIGRQELMAEVLDDIEGALWTRAMIDAARVSSATDLVRIGVGVDPSGGQGEGNDEQGIVVAGLGIDGDGYVLADRSCKLSPDGWGRRVVQAYLDFKADVVLVEKNFGGDMALATVETAARGMGVTVPITAVSASRGKLLRSEPVAALYEQGKVHHVGAFDALEDQMCFAAGTSVMTKNGEVPIEWVTTSDRVLTRDGYKPVLWAGQTGNRRTLWVLTAQGGMRCTPDHPVYVEGKGFTSAGEVQMGDKLLMCPQSLSARLWRSARNATTSTMMATTSPAAPEDDGFTTVTCGSNSTVRSQMDGTFTTLTTTGETTIRPIWSRSASPITCTPTTDTRTGAPIASLEANMLENNGKVDSLAMLSALPVALSSSPQGCAPHSALSHVVVVGIAPSGVTEPVYNLSVEGSPEFFANGLLVHNCSWVPGITNSSPDRLDALVWVATETLLQGPVGVWSL